MMFSMAMRGDLRAQKEYAAWLRKLERAKKAYKEAYDNEELETLAAYGYEVRVHLQFILVFCLACWYAHVVGSAISSLNLEDLHEPTTCAHWKHRWFYCMSAIVYLGLRSSR